MGKQKKDRRNTKSEKLGSKKRKPGTKLRHTAKSEAIIKSDVANTFEKFETSSSNIEKLDDDNISEYFTCSEGYISDASNSSMSTIRNDNFEKEGTSKDFDDYELTPQNDAKESNEKLENDGIVQTNIMNHAIDIKCSDKPVTEGKKSTKIKANMCSFSLSGNPNNQLALENFQEKGNVLESKHSSGEKILTDSRYGVKKKKCPACSANENEASDSDSIEKVVTYQTDQRKISVEHTKKKHSSGNKILKGTEHNKKTDHKTLKGILKGSVRFADEIADKEIMNDSLKILKNPREKSTELINKAKRKAKNENKEKKSTIKRDNSGCATPEDAKYFSKSEIGSNIQAGIMNAKKDKPNSVNKSSKSPITNCSPKTKNKEKNKWGYGVSSRHIIAGLTVIEVICFILAHFIWQCFLSPNN